jgi:MFS family permease
MSHATTAPRTPTVSPRRAWQALSVLLIGMFMSLLDATIVNVALPTIRTSLSANEATLSWIISGYALAFGLVLIPAGRLGDRFGHKWVFFTGLALFTVASLACGLALDSTQLVIARVIQGLAGGIYLPAVTAFIQILFSGRTRGKAFAIMGAAIGVSSALGPIVGGLLIQAFGEKEGWRYVFDVNVPIGIGRASAPWGGECEPLGRGRLGRPRAAGRWTRRDPGSPDRGADRRVEALDLPLPRRGRDPHRPVRTVGALVHEAG